MKLVENWSGILSRAWSVRLTMRRMQAFGGVAIIEHQVCSLEPGEQAVLDLAISRMGDDFTVLLPDWGSSTANEVDAFPPSEKRDDPDRDFADVNFVLSEYKDVTGRSLRSQFKSFW